MPLIIIDVLRGHDEDYLTALLDGVHDAVVEAFDVPVTDRYQILNQHEPYEMRMLDTGLGYTRGEDLTVIRIVSKARSDEAKHRLYELVVAFLGARLSIHGDDVILSVTENGEPDWSFGRGQAQFLTGEL